MEEKNLILAFFLKWWSYFFYIMVGLVAKFSYDLVKGKKITIWAAIGTTGISVFVGFLSSLWASTHMPHNAGIIVPISTLLADKVITALYSINVKQVANEWFKYWYDKTKK